MRHPLRLLCILAHPDDESLGTGGIVAHYQPVIELGNGRVRRRSGSCARPSCARPPRSSASAR